LLSGFAGYLILTAIPEEIVFRGVVFRGVEHLAGTIVALILSSAMFGAVHLMNPNATIVGALGTAVGGGVMLSAAYLVTRNLWLAIGIHWAADFWQGAFFGLRPSGSTFAHPLLHSTPVPRVWTGGDYGGGIIGLAIGCGAAAVLLVLAARRGYILRPGARHSRKGGTDGSLARRADARARAAGEPRVLTNGPFGRLFTGVRAGGHGATSDL
jgi:hypothetical protein